MKNLSKAQWWSSALAGAGIFISSFDLGAISIGLNGLRSVWHLSEFELSALGAASLLGMLLGSVVAGILADRFGRRVVLLFDFLAFVLAAAGSALAPTAWFFFVMRVAVGIGIGADFAVAFPYLAEVIPSDRRRTVMASVMWLANFGMLSAFALGAVTLSTGANGWRLTILAGAVLAIPLLLLRGFLGESGPWERLRNVRLQDAKGGATADAGSPQQEAPAAITTPKLRDLRVLRRPVATFFTRTALAQFFYQVTDQGLSLFLPSMLMLLASQDHARDVIVIGSLGSVAVKFVTIPAALLTVVLIAKLGPAKLQAWGFGGRALALGALAAVLLTDPASSITLCLLLLAVAYFFGAAGPDKTTVIIPSLHYPTARRATGQGLTEGVGRIGGIVGVLAYGALAGRFGIGAGLLLFAAACAFGWALSARGLEPVDAEADSALADPAV
ncbi:MAG: MFS transporter [Firmicutes bacterium]|nr:MFS transporter [Bacillota bacterium]